MSLKPIQPVKPQPYLMHNQIQNYEWGARDQKAFIPKLLGITPQPNTPYAELWMGAHPKASSQLSVDAELISLDQWIAAHPVELLGKAIAKKFDGKLPFLLKVLSAGEALSIQAHPNKAQAKILHANAPQHYPDDNHKPEIAIALDSLTALMGIKPFAELADTLRRYPEISGFIGADVCDKLTIAVDPGPHKQRDLARTLFTALLTRSVSRASELNAAIDKLALRLGAAGTGTSEADALFLSLRRKYSDADVGLFCIYLLNLVHLAAGQAMFAEAGVPHAYLGGNVIECMASSDNVVRVGLTPKYKDAQALIEILKCEPGPVDILGARPGSGTVTYKTPAPEFRVSRLSLKPGVSRHESTGNRPSIMVVTEGEISIRWEQGTESYRRGQSIFIPAALAEYSIWATQPAVIFKAEIPQ